jgi:hypothetical protein
MEPDAKPLAFVFEEAAMYSGSTWTLPEPISRVYRLGRRWKINCIAIAQIDTDLHRVFRACTQIYVALRSQKLSTDLQRHFDHEAVALLQPPRLENPWPDVPVKGVHYLTSPDDLDLFREWESAVSY